MILARCIIEWQIGKRLQSEMSPKLVRPSSIVTDCCITRVQIGVKFVRALMEEASSRRMTSRVALEDPWLQDIAPLGGGRSRTEPLGSKRPGTPGLQVRCIAKAPRTEGGRAPPLRRRRRVIEEFYERGVELPKLSPAMFAQLVSPLTDTPSVESSTTPCTKYGASNQ